MSLPLHAEPDSAGLLVAYLPVALLAAAWCGYLSLSLEARARRGWPVWRTVAFTAGMFLLAVAFSPSFDEFAEHDFSGHAAQHLLMAMVAPVLLVIGMPVTLMLRTLPYPAARRLGRLLNSRPARLLTTPSLALLAASGGLVLLYFTPLYALSTHHTPVHVLVHVHLVLSGFLFAWVIAGLDPAARRHSVRARLVALGIAIAVHATVSQLLYAGVWVQVQEPMPQMQAAGSLMYFGGDLAELLLALVMLLAARPPRRTTPRLSTPPAPRQAAPRCEPAAIGYHTSTTTQEEP
ncbi:cytochrome c oxidase assembly protein [Nocardioides gilvus]|uniref:cytochrome c oxidase assembly protein n=1 Tax=Nocardioides gilvus TaxID=1735589 RepID=UPI000D7462D7|nr:cytochrome c oxidase assembly protein [Nocardioides gilvus]